MRKGWKPRALSFGRKKSHRGSVICLKQSGGLSCDTGLRHFYDRQGEEQNQNQSEKKKRRTVSHFIISSSSKKEGMNRGWSVSHHRENTSRVSSCQKYSIKSKYEKVLGNL